MEPGEGRKDSQRLLPQKNSFEESSVPDPFLPSNGTDWPLRVGHCLFQCGHLPM